MNNNENSGLGQDFFIGFYRMAEASLGVGRSYEEFQQFIRSFVRPLIPHEMLLVAIGRVTFDQIAIDQMVSVDYPLEYMNSISRATNASARPVLAEWLEKQSPLLIDPSLHFHKMSELELAEIRDFNLGKLAIHGQIDVSKRMASYFSFARVPVLKQEYVRILELVVPHAHNAMMRVYRQSALASVECKLTAKEMEILKWIVLGRTNADIASILGKSEKTVRNQIQSILRKMSVENRSELIDRADSLGLLSVWK